MEQSMNGLIEVAEVPELGKIFRYYGYFRHAVRKFALNNLKVINARDFAYAISMLGSDHPIADNEFNLHECIITH